MCCLRPVHPCFFRQPPGWTDCSPWAASERYIFACATSMRRRRRRKQPDGPALPVVQCKPAKLVMHRSETSPAGSGGSTAGRALDPAGGGNGRPAQIRLPRASRLAAAGQGARLAGPPDPPGHLEPEFSGLNLHYVPPAGPAGPPARKLHPPGGEAGRTCRRPRPRRARRDKIRLAGWRETRRLAGSVSLKCHCIACGCGVRAGFHASLPSPRPEIDVWFQNPDRWGEPSPRLKT